MAESNLDKLKFTGKGEQNYLREAVNPRDSRNFQQTSETRLYQLQQQQNTKQQRKFGKPIWKHAFLNSKERETGQDMFLNPAFVEEMIYRVARIKAF